MSSHKETTRVWSCSRLQMESWPSTGHRQNTKEIGKMLVPCQTDSVIFGFVNELIEREMLS